MFYHSTALLTKTLLFTCPGYTQMFSTACLHFSNGISLLVCYFFTMLFITTETSLCSATYIIRMLTTWHCLHLPAAAAKQCQRIGILRVFFQIPKNIFLTLLFELACQKVMSRSLVLGNLSLYVAKLFSPFQCPNTYPVAVSRIRNESVT